MRNGSGEPRIEERWQKSKWKTQNGGLKGLFHVSWRKSAWREFMH